MTDIFFKTIEEYKKNNVTSKKLEQRITLLARDLEKGTQKGD